MEQRQWGREGPADVEKSTWLRPLRSTKPWFKDAIGPLMVELAPIGQISPGPALRRPFLLDVDSKGTTQTKACEHLVLRHFDGSGGGP